MAAQDRRRHSGLTRRMSRGGSRGRAGRSNAGRRADRRPRVGASLAVLGGERTTSPMTTAMTATTATTATTNQLPRARATHPATVISPWRRGILAAAALVALGAVGLSAGAPALAAAPKSKSEAG